MMLFGSSLLRISLGVSFKGGRVGEREELPSGGKMVKDFVSSKLLASTHS